MTLPCGGKSWACKACEMPGENTDVLKEEMGLGFGIIGSNGVGRALKLIAV